MTDVTQEQTAEAQAPVETPAVPDFDAATEADEAIAEAEKPPPTRRKKKAETAARRQAAYARGEASKDKMYDEWIQDWDWNQPRMYCTLKRTSPQLHLGQQVGGRLDGKPNGYFTEEEIQQRFGGGTFLVYVSGIDSRSGKFKALGNKQVVIGAEPKIEAVPQQVVDAGTGAPQQQGGSGVSDLAPQAQAGLVGLVGQAWERSERRMSQPVAPAADPELMKDVYEGQVRTVKEAAAKEAEILRGQMNEMRQELSQLRIERDTYQNKVETEVNAARADGERYVGQMIPTFAAQANDRVQQVYQDAGEKVRSIQEQYARDLQNQQAYMQQQLQNQQTLFQAAETNAQTLFQGQIAHLQTLNATLQAKIDALEGECRALRDQVLNMHQEAARKQDPMSRLQEMQTFQEVIQGMSGGGGGDDLGEDASPALKLAARFAPAIAGAIDVAKAKMGIDAGPPQQQMLMQPPQQMRPPPQMVPPGAMPRIAAPQPGTPPPRSGAMVKAPQAPQAPPQRRARIPRPDAKVSKQDLVAGIALLNAAIAAGADPQTTADTAAGQIDRGTLNALCARKPEVVIQSLQAAGILQGAVASEPGLQYLTAFLQALARRLNPPPPELEVKEAPAEALAEAPPAEEPADDKA